MNIKIRFWMALAGLTLIWAMRASAMDGKDMKPYQGTADFQRIRTLSGSWKGNADLGNGPQDFTVEFQPSANGSIVVEKLFAGTPHEMLDVYYDQGKKLRLTHYCSSGNRPHMALKQSDAQEIRFVLSDDPVIDAGHDTHMHSLKIKFVDDNHITEDWMTFKHGKESGVSSFQLTRVPAATPPAAPSFGGSTSTTAPAAPSMGSPNLDSQKK